MYITGLEIDNFKSFSRKTRIPFLEGFTVISGPNGSGKSNIIDAILFVLGLTGARGLRAEKLTDLINVNSGKNTAEVAITFSDGTEIRRRVRRTKNNYYSYYYMNRRLCKQSDILEFLRRFGIKPEGYNVVMQGDITRIMEMSGIERRQIIDEIAGVTEFDAKKEKSLMELEVVRERIDREEILLNELKSRARELEVEREKALIYHQLREESESLSTLRQAAILQEKLNEQKQMERIIADLLASKEECEKRLAAVNDEIARRKEELSRLDREIEEKSSDEYLRLVSRIEEEKSTIKMAESEIARLKTEKEETSGAQRRAFMDASRAAARIDELSETIQSMTVDRSGLAMELNEIQGRIERLEGLLDEASRECEGMKEKHLSLLEEINRLKGERSDLINRRDALIEKSRLRSSEMGRIRENISRLKEELDRLRSSSEERRRLMDERRKRKEDLERQISETESSLFRYRDKAGSIADAIRTKEREIIHLEAQQQATGGPGGRALDAVLGMEGVYGTISQLGKVPPEYATALNTAAGSRLGWVVVETDQVAEDAIRYLKEHRLGRLTFLPLNRIKPPSTPPLNDPSVIGYAIDLLEFDRRFEPAFRLIFGGTVVVESLSIARKMIGRYRMVTLEGELIERHGAMTGGSLPKKPRHGFGVAVDEDIARLRGELDSLQKEEEEISSIIRHLEEQSQTLRREYQECETAIAGNRMLDEEQKHREGEITAQLRSLEETLRSMEEEMLRCSGELAGIEQQLDGINDSLSDAGRTMEKLKKELEDDRLPAITQELEMARRERDDVERRLRQKEADIADAHRERQYFRNRKDEIEAGRAQLAEKERSIEAGIRACQEEIEAARSRIAMMESDLESFSQNLQALRAKRDEYLEDLHRTESELLDLRGEVERLLLQINNASERLDALNEEISAFPAELHDRRCEMSLADIDKRLEEVQTSLERLGAVNMLAVEEYDRIGARIAERTERKETLSRERTELIERIERFEKMKYDAFMKSFRAIDENFRKIFTKLTEGSGHLVLECEEDPFAGGLTFAVKPRDKKVHLLSALSGGEKSLTTLAFIFAIQQYMPAPFYALDEVDMFLDGENVERIAEMIKDLSGDAQSIVVSLRRPMIERADRIIGVTLREDKSTYLTGITAHD
ncbi:MAG: chromosome segregation protein SMC [Methanoculleaceae archaeon]